VIVPDDDGQPKAVEKTDRISGPESKVGYLGVFRIKHYLGMGLPDALGGEIAASYYDPPTVGESVVDHFLGLTPPNDPSTGTYTKPLMDPVLLPVPKNLAREGGIWPVTPESGDLTRDVLLTPQMQKSGGFGSGVEQYFNGGADACEPVMVDVIKLLSGIYAWRVGDGEAYGVSAGRIELPDAFIPGTPAWNNDRATPAPGVMMSNDQVLTELSNGEAKSKWTTFLLNTKIGRIVPAWKNLGSGLSEDTKAAATAVIEYQNGLSKLLDVAFMVFGNAGHDNWSAGTQLSKKLQDANNRITTAPSGAVWEVPQAGTCLGNVACNTQPNIELLFGNVGGDIPQAKRSNNWKTPLSVNALRLLEVNTAMANAQNQLNSAARPTAEVLAPASAVDKIAQEWNEEPWLASFAGYLAAKLVGYHNLMVDAKMKIDAQGGIDSDPQRKIAFTFSIAGIVQAVSRPLKNVFDTPKVKAMKLKEADKAAYTKEMTVVSPALNLVTKWITMGQPSSGMPKQDKKTGAIGVVDNASLRNFVARIDLEKLHLNPSGVKYLEYADSGDAKTTTSYTINPGKPNSWISDLSNNAEFSNLQVLANIKDEIKADNQFYINNAVSATAYLDFYNSLMCPLSSVVDGQPTCQSVLSMKAKKDGVLWAPMDVKISDPDNIVTYRIIMTMKRTADSPSDTGLPNQVYIMAYLKIGDEVLINVGDVSALGTPDTLDLEYFPSDWPQTPTPSAILECSTAKAEKNPLEAKVCLFELMNYIMSLHTSYPAGTDIGDAIRDPTNGKVTYERWLAALDRTDDVGKELRRNLIERSFRKGLGDFLQELNGVLSNYGYVRTPTFWSKREGRAGIFKAGDVKPGGKSYNPTPWQKAVVQLNNDCPSALRDITFIIDSLSSSNVYYAKTSRAAATVDSWQWGTNMVGQKFNKNVNATQTAGYVSAINPHALSGYLSSARSIVATRSHPKGQTQPALPAILGGGGKRKRTVKKVARRRYTRDRRRKTRQRKTRRRRTIQKTRDQRRNQRKRTRSGKP